MTDQELLEAAAKAAGICIDKSTQNGGGLHNTGFDGMGNVVLDWHNGTKWNPLTDDGDALRLAVGLNMGVQSWSGQDGGYALARWSSKDDACVSEVFDAGGDPTAATRRAIVRAAAEIGKTR